MITRHTQNSWKSELEKWLPYIIGFIFTLLYYLLSDKKTLPDSLKDIFSAATSFSSITIGFLATAMSILLSIDNNHIIRELKNVKIYYKLIDYFMDAIKISFIVALLSLLGLFLDLKATKSWYFLAFHVWLFFLITSGSCSYRIIDVFAKILRYEKSN